MTPAELREARATLGLTQAALAKRLSLRGVYAQQLVSRWERGVREIPGPVAVAVRLMVEISPAKLRPR